jgi:Na+-driven multidrug efflux pump
LGKGDRRSAADVFRRTLTLALGCGVLVLAGLMALRTALPGLFTKDAAVIAQVAQVSWPAAAVL